MQYLFVAKVLFAGTDGMGRGAAGFHTARNRTTQIQLCSGLLLGTPSQPGFLQHVPASQQESGCRPTAKCMDWNVTRDDKTPVILHGNVFMNMVTTVYTSITNTWLKIRLTLVLVRS